jgi:hypothetical protein
VQGQPLILQESAGERRLHRPPPGGLSNLTTPFIVKVDRRNGGAPEFVMFTEDILPGQAIPPAPAPGRGRDPLRARRDRAGRDRQP